MQHFLPNCFYAASWKGARQNVLALQKIYCIYLAPNQSVILLLWLRRKTPRFSRGEYLNFWNKINLFSSLYCYCDKRIVERVLYGLHILSTLKHFNVQLNYRYRNDFSKRIQEPTWNSVGSRFKTNNASYWVVKKTMSAENIGGWVLHTIIFSPSQCLLSQQLSCSIMQVNEEISSKTFWTHLSNTSKFLNEMSVTMKSNEKPSMPITHWQ